MCILLRILHETRVRVNTCTLGFYYYVNPNRAVITKRVGFRYIATTLHRGSTCTTFHHLIALVEHFVITPARFRVTTLLASNFRESRPSNFCRLNLYTAPVADD